MNRIVSALALVVAACLLTPACFLSRKKTAKTPPPPQRTSAHRKAAAKKTASQERRRAAPAHKTAPAATAAAPPPVRSAPEPPRAPAGSLREILSPEERADLTRSLEQSLDSARRALLAVSARALSQEQADTANMARSFVAQAEKARVNDLAVAAQLAHRAEVLADSLLASAR